MIILLIIAAIIGVVVSGFTGFCIAGWIAGGFVFLCGLPGALVTSFVHGEVSYAQDRADYRQMLSDLSADIRAGEHEFAEDDRINRLVNTVSDNPLRIYNDNRQIHVHGGMMTLYELYDKRIQHANIELTYGKGLWALWNRLVFRFWTNRLNNSAVGALSKELAAAPQRSKKWVK